MTPPSEIDRVLRQIRALALELHRLEGDGLDAVALTPRRHELELLRIRLADLVRHDPSLAAA